MYVRLVVYVLLLQCIQMEKLSIFKLENAHMTLYTRNRAMEYTWALVSTRANLSSETHTVTLRFLSFGIFCTFVLKRNKIETLFTHRGAIYSQIFTLINIKEFI